MTTAEIKKQVRAYEKAVEAEKAARKSQKNIENLLVELN